MPKRIFKKTLTSCHHGCPNYGERTIFCGHDVEIPYCEMAKQDIRHGEFKDGFPEFCKLEKEVPLYG